MNIPSSIRISKRMRLALERVRPLVTQWAKECDIDDVRGDDLSASRIVEDALACYELRLKQAILLQEDIAAEIESSVEAIRRNIP